MECWIEAFSRLEVGAVVAERYELLGFLGTGESFAAAYRAQDLQTGRAVALKLPPCREELEASKQRFLEDARRLADFSHEGVVKLLDFGLWGARRQPYLVMELLEGEDLSVLIRAGGLKPSRAIQLIQQALEALSSLHAAGIAHRMLKPSHLLRVHAGQPGERLKLVDFSLMDLEDGMRRLVMYIPSNFICRYFDPWCADARYLGPRGDVYLLGLVFVELITGRSAVKKLSDGSFVLELLRGEIYLPEPLLDCGLEPVFQGALSSSLEERFPDAGAFLEALVAVDTSQIDSLDLSAPPRRLWGSGSSGHGAPRG